METGQHPAPARLRALPSWLLGQAAVAAHRLTDHALAGAGLRRHHFAMLCALEEFGPSSQTDLGRCTSIDRSDVAAAINALADGGHIDRTPDPTDGRRNIITITPAGTALLDRLGILLDQAQDELLHSWTPTERNDLTAQLARILDAKPTSTSTPPARGAGKADSSFS